MVDAKTLEEIQCENRYLKEVQKQYRRYRDTIREMLISGELQLTTCEKGQRDEKA